MGERRQHPAKRTRQTASSSRRRTDSGRSSTRRTPADRTRRSTRRAPANGSTVRRPRDRRAATGRTQRSTPARSSRTAAAGRAMMTKARAGAQARAKARRRRGPRRVPLGSSPLRVRVIGVAMAIVLSICAGRLLQLQGFDAAAYGAIAQANLTTTTPLLPARGEITDRNGVVLAATEPAVNITADPTLTSQDCTEPYVGPLCGLQQATRVAEIIAEHTEIDVDETIAQLVRHDTRFAYVKKKVPAHVYSDISAQLSEEGLPGIYRESNPIRTYPSGRVASNVVGFVGYDNQGQAGFEYSRNKALAGVEGSESYESAPNGSRIPLGESTIVPAKNGVNYQLSIDSELQWAAQRRLQQAVSETESEAGWAITMDVTTGQILAMANAPSFDSSDPGEADSADLGNRAISHAYEPGSVQKILTSAALIDSGTADPGTKVVVPPTISSGGGRIKDSFGHGTLKYRMRGVIAFSSNIGTVLLSRQLEKQTLHDYLTSFGLGQPTGIELPGEASGRLPEPEMEDYTRDQIAFGQGLSVTGVQEAAALAAVINGGTYHAPTVVESATNADGTAAELNRPAPRRVVSEKTSKQVRDLMEAVVTHNDVSMQHLALDDYRSGGKTGTAERYDPECGCYNGYVTSYVGFAPIDNPRIMTYVVLDNPKRGDSGTGTAAPVYTDIMDLALPRYGIAPDQKSKEWGREQMDRPLTW